MEKIWIWFLLSCKRHLVRPAYLVLLLFVPLAVYAISGEESKEQEGIGVALYAPEDSLSRKTVERLTKQEGMFRFYESESAEKLQEDVAARKAECGFVFPRDLGDRMDQNQYKRAITLYRSPATVTDALACEVVSSVLLQVYGQDLYMDYMTESPVFQGRISRDRLPIVQELFQKRMGDGSTFSFAYESAGGGAQAAGRAAARTFPARGLTAVYVFVAGLFAAVTMQQDEKRGMFLTIPGENRFGCGFAGMLGPVVLAGASGLLSMAVSGLWAGEGKEIAGMAAYCVLVTGFSFALGKLVRNPSALCALVPFWIIGSFLLCPVFLDIGQWIPELSFWGKLFPPYYYIIQFR